VFPKIDLQFVELIFYVSNAGSHRDLVLFGLINDRCRRFIAAGCVVNRFESFGHSAKQIDKPCQDLDLLATRAAPARSASPTFGAAAGLVDLAVVRLRD